MSIRILPAHVAARIAAGEVVERPASVVKELVENAVDSGATSIQVIVRGERLGDIIVSDNGCGMPPEDLALAPFRHATSKLVDDDVFKVATLGYRGEALPSISAVASLRITSRPHGQDCAFAITVSPGGTPSKPRPSSGQMGTRVEVAGLFESHPARLKFMKSRPREAAGIREVLSSIALSHPEIEFRYEVNGTAGFYAARASICERAADVLGTGFSKDSVEVLHDQEGIRVRGLACIPSAARTDASGLRFSVNGRPVTDKTLRAAVQSAYSALIGPGRHPMAYIAIEVPSEAVDVNVHPRKAEVRFARPREIAAAVSMAVSDALDRSSLRSPSGLADLARSLAQVTPAGMEDRRRLPLGRFLGQAGSSWIVAETVEGIVIVDQHAAHERVIMERLRNALPTGDTARFPHPRVVEVSLDEAAAVDDCLGVIRGMGFELEVGDAHLELSGVPAVLADCDPEELGKLIARCAADGCDGGLMAQAVWEKLATAACKAAIKAGQSLSTERADALLREIEATPAAAQCNHGRPTVAFLSDRDIAKLFARG